MAVTRSVGRVSIRVVPDSVGFRQDLQTTLERIERTMRARIPVEFIVDREELLKLKAELDSIRASIKIGLDVPQEEIERLRAQLEAISANIDVDLSTAAAERRIEALTRTRDVLIRARVLELGRGGNNFDLTGGFDFGPSGVGGFFRNLFSNPYAEAGAREGFGSMLSGLFSGSGIMSAVTSLAQSVWGPFFEWGKTWGQRFFASGGGQVLTDMFLEGREFINDIDRNTVKFAQMFTMLSAVSNALTASIGSIFIVAVELGQIISGLAVVAPSILAPLAVGIGTLFAVLKDTKTVLADLGPTFDQLQNKMSNAFWDKLAPTIRALTDQLLPSLTRGLVNVSQEFSWMFASMFAAISKGLGNGVLDRLFDRMASSINIASEGVYFLTNALIKMVDAGSKFWEYWARGFTEGMKSFDNWVDRIISDGTFDKFIQDMTRNLFNLFRLFDGLFGIINGIASAAKLGGLPDLADWANATQKMAAAIQSPALQKVLSQLFGGAQKAMAGIFDGLGNGFREAAPIFEKLVFWGQVMGGIYDDLLTKIGQIIGNKTFIDGLDAFIGGLSGAIDRFDEETINNIANSLGSTLDLMGHVIDGVGKVVAAYFKYLAPTFDKISDMLGYLSGPVAQAISDIMQNLAPAMESLWNNVLKPMMLDFKDKILPALVDLSKQAGPLLVDAFRVLGWVMRTIVMPSIEGIITIGSTLARMYNIVRDKVKEVVRAIQDFFDTVKKHADALDKIFKDPAKWFETLFNFMGTNGVVEQVKKKLEEFFKPLIKLITDPLGWFFSLGGSKGVGGTAGGAMMPQGKINLDDMFEVTDPLAKFREAVSLGWETFKATWTGMWDGFWANVRAVWDGFWGQFNISPQNSWFNISGGWTSFLSGLIAGAITWFASLSSNWNTMWTNIGTWASTKWNEINAGWANFLAEMIAKALGFVVEVRAKWDEFWNGVSQVASTIWETIKGTVSGGMNNTRAEMNNTGGMQSSWQSFMNTVRSITDIGFNMLVGAVRGGVNNAAAETNTLPSRVNLGNLGYVLYSSGQSLIGGFISGMQSMIGAAMQTAAGIMSILASFFPHSPAKRGPFSGRGYTTWSGRALVSDFAGGMMSNMNLVRDAAMQVATAANFDAMLGVDVADSGIVIDRREVNIHTYNPVAEPTSRTIDRASSALKMTAVAQ